MSAGGRSTASRDVPSPGVFEQKVRLIREIKDKRALLSYKLYWRGGLWLSGGWYGCGGTRCAVPDEAYASPSAEQAVQMRHIAVQNKQY
eukprot:2674171-Rhodomonas_salina.2